MMKDFTIEKLLDLKERIPGKYFLRLKILS